MRAIGIFVAAAALILSILAWFWLSGAATPLLPPITWAPAVLTYALPVTGVVAGLSGGALMLAWLRWLRERQETTPPSADTGAGVTAGSAGGLGQALTHRAALLLGFVFPVIVILVLAAVGREDIKPVAAILVLICGTLTLIAGSYLLDGLARGDSIEINSHWGGLGGSLGGWRLSPITTLLALALVLLGATFMAGVDRQAVAQNNSADAPRNQTTPVPAPASARTAGNQAGGANTVAAANAAAANNAAVAADTAGRALTNSWTAR